MKAGEFMCRILCGGLFELVSSVIFFGEISVMWFCRSLPIFVLAFLRNWTQDLPAPPQRLSAKV